MSYTKKEQEILLEAASILLEDYGPYSPEDPFLMILTILYLLVIW